LLGNNAPEQVGSAMWSVFLGAIEFELASPPLDISLNKRKTELFKF